MSMDYLALLEHSFTVEQSDGYGRNTRLEYLAMHIFDFTTYDFEMDELFAHKALEVCRAVSGGKTQDLVANPDAYKWYLLMCNMPFFANRLDWGTSIRGAWWDFTAKNLALHTCGLYVGKDQLLDLEFTHDEWLSFVAALLAFAAPEMSKPQAASTLVSISLDDAIELIEQHESEFGWRCDDPTGPHYGTDTASQRLYRATVAGGWTRRDDPPGDNLYDED